MIPIETNSIEIMLGVVTLLISTFLGLMIYRREPTSWTHRLFLLLAFLIDVYIVVNYISLHPPEPVSETQLFWIRIVMFTTSLIGPVLVMLVHAFPGPKFTLNKIYVSALLILMSLSSIAALGPWVFTSIEYPGGEPVPIPGIGMPIFLLDFVGLFILSFIIAIVRYRRAEGVDKIQLLFFLTGVIASFSLMAVSTVVSVIVLKTSAAVFLGPIFPVILMWFIAYAIVKHNLFDIRTIAANLLIGGLWIILAARIFASSTYVELVLDVLVLWAAVTLGILVLKSVKREVEDREKLAKMASSFEQANLRLKDLDQQKTEFLTIASHQLMTPLSIIKLNIELIQDGACGNPTKKLLTTLSEMDQSNERLIKLVDEFLDVTRIEQGRTEYDFKPHDLDTLISDVVHELTPKAEQKKLKLLWKSGKPHVASVMDEEKIRHVVFNFIDNAIKYTDKGSVRVLLETDEQSATVRVVDTGIGFTKSDEANLFQKFYRGENVKKIDMSGTGLGIYVCRKFIEMHGGKVWAKSGGLGKGSEFGFRIPKKRPSS